MSFGGSVLAMIQSLRANARPRHSVFEDLENAEKRIYHTNRKLVDKQVSPEELERIKLKLKRNIEKERKKSLIIVPVIIILMIPILGFIGYRFLFDTRVAQIPAFHQPSPEKIEADQINYLLNSGFEWLQKNHYKNARFQFNRVLESEPENNLAIYGLTASYVFECKIDHSNCEEARKMLSIYISKNGENESSDYLNEMLQE